MGTQENKKSKKESFFLNRRFIILGIIAILVMGGFVYYFLTNILINSKASSPFTTIAAKNACYEQARGNTHRQALCITFASVKANGVWTYPTTDSACVASYGWCYYGKEPGSGGSRRPGNWSKCRPGENPIDCCPAGTALDSEGKCSGA